MSTIFDGYDKLNDKQIINQLALLETISFSNILKFHKSKLKESTVGTIKKLLGTSDKEEEKNEQDKVSELYNLLTEYKKELRKLSREQLDIKLKSSICEKSGSDITDSEDVISLEAINEAVKKFDLPKHLTPSQKIDEIFNAYNEKILKSLEENPGIVNQNKSLDLTEPKLLIYVLTEAIKSVDMIQGSRKIDRELLTECIWIAALGNAEVFTPLTENLPSFKFKPSHKNIYLEDTEFLDSRDKYRESIEELEKNDYKLLELEKVIDKFEKSLLIKKSQLIELDTSKKENEKKLREIEVDLDFIVNIYDASQRETRNEDLIRRHREVSQHTMNNKRDIEVLEKEVKEIDKYLSDLKFDREYLVREEKNLKDSRNDMRRDYMTEADKRYYSLKKLWESHFRNFEIESQFLKEAVEYTIEDRIEIERVLEEIKMSKDPKVMSSNFKKEQIKNHYNIEFLIRPNRVVCIEYKIDKTEDKIRVKLVRILESTE